MGECSFCGKPVYAKGLCKNCYNRKHKTGSLEYKRVMAKVGDQKDGWEIIEISETGGKIRCINCGMVKEINGKASQFLRYQPHGCKVAFNPSTDKQKRIVEAYISSGYSQVEAAKKIGVSRQYIQQVLRRCVV